MITKPARAGASPVATGIHVSGACVPSTVWMYRQLEALLPETQLVFAWKHHSPDLFPVPADKLRLVPAQFDKPLKGLSVRSIRCCIPNMAAHVMGSGLIVG